MRYVGWQCRLYPNASQRAALLRCRNALRELANTLLANSQLSYTETGRRLTLAELRKVTRDWRGEVLDRGCPASAIYRVGADLDRAFRDSPDPAGKDARTGLSATGSPDPAGKDARGFRRSRPSAGSPAST